MAVPTHRRILAATVTVLLFWSGVFGVYSWFTDKHTLLLFRLGFVPDRLLWVLAITFLAAALLFFWEAAEVFAITLGLRPRSRRGCSTTTLGMLPKPAFLPKWQPLPRKKRLERLAEVIQEVGTDARLDTVAIRRFAQSASPRAELFWTVLEILDQSALPASPFRGSHGDSSLVAHSLRVSAALARIWAEHRSDTSPSRVDQPASSRPFDQETAILAGLAHDLGKVLCFRRQKNGNIEVIGLHDIEGSRLLARLDAFWDLVDAKGQHDDVTQRLLTQAIRYYHHPYAYPASGTKRVFVRQDGAVVELMQLIRQADLVAGSIEGRESEILADYQDGNELPERDLADQVWESFQYLMSQTNLINHPSPERRLGYKQGNALYLAEKRLRALICDHLSITRPDYLGSNNGNPGKIIGIVAQKLDAEGCLKKGLGEKVCNKPEGAGFYLRIEGTSKDGEAREAEEKIPYYVVLIPPSGFLAPYADLDDYRSRITLLRPTWPQYFVDRSKEPDATDDPSPSPEGAVKAPDLPQEPSEIEDEASTLPQDEEATTGDDNAQDEDPGNQDSPFDVAEPAEQEAASEPEAESPEEPSARPSDSERSRPDPKRDSDTEPEKAEPHRKRPRKGWTEAERRERQRKLFDLAAKADRPHNSPRMTRRALLSPDELIAQTRNRVQHLLRTYPNILTAIPGRTNALPDHLRKRLLFALVWLDQVQRDRRQMTEANATVYRGSVAELMDANTPGAVRDLIVETLRAVGFGPLPVLEIHMLLDLRTRDDGRIDLDASTLIAPINEVPDAARRSG